MTVFLIIAGVIGILISLFSLFMGVQYIYMTGSVMPNTVWQLATLPILSTILLFVFWHWIFVIPIFLLIVQFVQMLLLKSLEDRKGHQIDLISSPMANITMFSNVIFGLLGRIIIICGAAILITLRITIGNPAGPTIWSLWLPVFLVCMWIFTGIANWTVAHLFGILVSRKSYLTFKRRMKGFEEFDEEFDKFTNEAEEDNSYYEPNWVELIRSNLPLNWLLSPKWLNAVRRQKLEAIRLKYNISDGEFIHILIEGSTITKWTQYHYLEEFKKQKPNASEKELLDELISSRGFLPKPFGYNLTAEEIEEAQRTVNSIDEFVCQYIINKVEGIDVLSSDEIAERSPVSKEIEDILSE